MNLKNAVLKAGRALQARLSNLLGLSATERALSAPVVTDPDRHGIALVAIVKDEARYIGEWNAFHTNLGVRSIYIYDNGSADETVAWLRVESSWLTFVSSLDEFRSAYPHSDCCLQSCRRQFRPSLSLDDVSRYR